MRKERKRVEEVLSVIRDLEEVLNLKEDWDRESLKRFVKWDFANIEVNKASLALLGAILVDGHIENRASKAAINIAPKLPKRSYKEVVEKLIYRDSVNIAVSILFLIREIPDYAERLYETGMELLEDSDKPAAQARLEKVVLYIENYINKKGI